MRWKFYDLLVAHKSPVAAEAWNASGDFMPSKRKSEAVHQRSDARYGLRLSLTQFWYVLQILTEWLESRPWEEPGSF